MGIIDLLSFAPNILSWFLPVTQALINAIGVLRLIRLIKVTRYMRGFRTIGRVLRKHYREACLERRVRERFIAHEEPSCHVPFHDRDRASWSQFCD